MPMNPATDEIVRELRESIAERPPSFLEHALIDQLIAEAPNQLPLPAAALGEAMIQLASMLRSLLKAVRDADAALGGCLDWESTVIIAENITMSAGLALYTGGEG